MVSGNDFTKLGQACLFDNVGKNYRVRGLAKKVNYVPASGRGASYIDITLCDSTGEYPGKLWGDQRLSREDAANMNGHIVEMTATVDMHDGKARLLVNAGQWRCLNDSEVKDWTEFAYFLTKEDREGMTEYVRSFIDSMDDKRGLKDLVTELFEKHLKEILSQ